MAIFLPKNTKYFVLKMIERRKHKRYRISKDAFVFSSAHPGRVKDISMGGMAFSHVYDANDENELGTLSILDNDNDFYMKGINCRIISDSVENSLFPISFMHINNKSVQFSLSPEQSDKLSEYIRRHNLAEV